MAKEKKSSGWIDSSNRIILLLAILGVVIYAAVIYIGGYFQDIDTGNKGRSALVALDDLRSSFVLHKEQELLVLQSADKEEAASAIQRSINLERLKLSNYIKLSDYNEELNSTAPKIWLTFEAWSSLAAEMASGESEPELTQRSLSAFLSVMEMLDQSDRILNGEVQTGEIASRDFLVITLVLQSYLILLAFWLMWTISTRERRNYRNARVLHQMSNTDTLTGLTNRVILEDRCATAIAGARRFGSFVGVLYIDIDGLNEINVDKGYQAGDLVLKEAALRLQMHTREMDTVARVGEDEFSVLASNLKRKEDIAVVADKLRDVLTKPVELGKEKYTLSVSIGYAVFPDDGENAEQLVNCANSAMYKAKGMGNDSVASIQH